jgi:hypothetical protein
MLGKAVERTLRPRQNGKLLSEMLRAAVSGRSGTDWLYDHRNPRACA